MLTETNLPLARWLSGIQQDILEFDNVLARWVSEIYEHLNDALRGYKAAPQILTFSDRRKPAYVQLRKAWNRLDDESREETLNWLIQKTLTDPLSGLETLVAREVSGSKPDGWVEAISDLNGLKAINDAWGHEAGNEIIRRLGKIINIQVEINGGRAFRVGGDEICYWFPNLRAARQALERIDSQFQVEIFEIGGRQRTGFSLSYGIGQDASSADNALYQDKGRRKQLGQRAEPGQMPESITLYYPQP